MPFEIIQSARSKQQTVTLFEINAWQFSVGTRKSSYLSSPIHRAWIAEFFVFILVLPVKVLDGFHIKWYEMKAGTFNLPGAWFATRAMRICSWILARRWTGPTGIFPPPSLYYYTRVNVQRQALQIAKIAVFNLKNNSTQYLRLKYVYFDVKWEHLSQSSTIIRGFSTFPYISSVLYLDCFHHHNVTLHRDCFHSMAIT